MPWYSNIIDAITGKNCVDIAQVKQIINSNDINADITDRQLRCYIKEIDKHVKEMVTDLKTLYQNFDIKFSGFKSFEMASNALKDSMKKDKEEVYNTLIKLDALIAGEQKRHLSLIRLAVTKDGRSVMGTIVADPTMNATFTRIFGKRDPSGKNNTNGIYQQLASDVHKFAEYIVAKKNRVYH